MYSNALAFGTMSRMCLIALFALCAGILLGVATFTSWLWPMAPISIALLLYLMFTSSHRTAFFTGWLYGFGLMGAAFSWGFSILPIDWLGISDPRWGFILVAASWLVFSCGIGAVVGVWAFVIRFLRPEWSLLIVVPFTWVVFELLRALSHALLAWGSGSALGFDLSFGFAGYALAWSGYLWMAKAGGVLTLSALCAFLGTVIFFACTALQSGSQQEVRAAVFILSGIFFVGYLIPSPVHVVYNPDVVTADGLRITPIQTDIPSALTRTSAEFAAIERVLVDAIMQALKKNPDIILLPEYVRYFKSESLLSADEATRVREALASARVLLIDSERSVKEEGGYGSVLFYDGEAGAITARQHKRILIPFGEYLPDFSIWILRKLGFHTAVDAVLAYRTYVRFDASFSSRVFEWRGVKLGVLACSESLSPFGYKEVADAGADVLMNVASHSWLREGAPMFLAQTLAMARIHATYTGKVYVQASNNSPSYVIYPRTRSPVR